MDNKKIARFAGIITLCGGIAIMCLEWQQGDHLPPDGKKIKLGSLINQAEASGIEEEKYKGTSTHLPPNTNRKPVNPGKEITGLRFSLEARGAEDLKTQMTGIWESFYQEAGFHNNVDWKQKVELYAIYEDLTEHRVRVTIGYPTDLMVKPFPDTVISRAQASPSRTVPVNGQDIASVLKAWETITWEPAPRSVTEVYQLNDQGDVQMIHLEMRH